MPVQINEMVIRANIMEPHGKPAGDKKPAETSINKEEIIKECTEKIMQLLNDKKER
jgi:hypothetical protein